MAVMAQLAPAATDAPQVLIWAKALLETETDSDKVTLPMLVSVIVCEAEGIPMGWTLKFIVAELSET